MWSRSDGERRFIVLDLFVRFIWLSSSPCLILDAICLTISFIVSNIVAFPYFFFLLLFCHLLMLGYALMSDSCCCCCFLLIIYFALKQREHEKPGKDCGKEISLSLLSCSQFNTNVQCLHYHTFQDFLFWFSRFSRDLNIFLEDFIFLLVIFYSFS